VVNAYLDFPSVMPNTGAPESTVAANGDATQGYGTNWTSCQSLNGGYTLGFANPMPIGVGKGVAAAGPGTVGQAEFIYMAAYHPWNPTRVSWWTGGTAPGFVQTFIGDVKKDQLTSLDTSYDGEWMRFTINGDSANWSASVSKAFTGYFDHDLEQGSDPPAARNSILQGSISGSKYLGKVRITPNSDDIAVVNIAGDQENTDVVDTSWNVMAPHRGDATLDGSIDFNDLVKVSQNYNTTGTNWATGDFNNDHATDFSDLVYLSQDYNTTYGWPGDPPPAPSAPFGPVMSNLDLFNRDAVSLGLPAVPEPASLSLLLAGALLCCRRSSKR
jgi:hypothetical protein